MTLATAKAAVVAAWAAALASQPEVLVVDGPPDANPAPDVVALLGGERVAVGDEETYELALVVSCYVGGGQEAQALATARAYSLLSTLHDTLTGAPAVGGVCRVAAIDTDNLRHGEAVGYDASGRVPVGRVTEISGTVIVWTGRTLAASLAAAHVAP